MRALNVAACLLATSFVTALHAEDAARFDLAGPKIKVRVTRGDTTLPIAQVPNLQPGDKLWIKADLPATQSNHLILIVAFLRGTTNEPPDNWFTEIDTWEKKTIEGTTVTVPAEAQQAVMFLAPETGGDFKTLRSAVKGKPGLFIRADADLNQASFEQQRIERYLAAMKTVSPTDSKAIQDHSTKLAATLALKPNADCFKQPVDQQVTCLTQSSAPVLLDDGHGQTVAEALSTGPSSDFINAASYTSAAGAGVYSAYVGAVVDLVHLVGTLRTAQYQYIPGLSFPDGESLSLRLNTPPSFHKPESVIVIGLPAIQKAALPPLRLHNADQVACLLQPKVALQLEGAPLVFSSSFAHDLVLHLNRTGDTTDLPLHPDAFEGGLIVSENDKRQPLKPASDKPKPEKTDAKPGSPTDLTITGKVSGYWGFDAFDGPTVTLQQVRGKDWKIVGNTQLLAGQDNHLTLKGDGDACVQHIALASEKAKDVDVTYKAADGKDAKDTLNLDVPLKTVQPGGYSLAILQYGDKDQDKVPLTAYNAGIKLENLKIHGGDNTAILTGEGLKDVVSVDVDKQTFTPTGDSNDDKTVHLQAKSGVSPDDGADATVKLKDGRTMPVNIAAEAARPGLNLLSFKATAAQKDDSMPVTLGAKDDIPLDGTLTFVVQTKDAMPRTQTIEVATLDGSVTTALSLAANNLVLQDDHTAVATLDPLKSFGQSAFGKLQMRPVASDGTPGAWTPLGTLVRSPSIKAIHCTTQDAPTCTLDGSNLFLVQSFGAGKDFAKPADVPTGYADSTYLVPTPSDGSTIYLKLRDDPNALASVTLPAAIPKPAPAAPTAQNVPAAQTTPSQSITVAPASPAAKPTVADPTQTPADPK
ncbi:hypothetical protein [Granulicella tundricola]|uniref:Uncharacterized protein n=1 Tax=Granulicella tundricola (strain ATCC BAA-1859 / DSM 23138 / MP5ACTX9) TaxID=1198114 RepID=E8X5Z7_GRATM|nr:hypothetical protein [Granulicella tundricola]ADW70881.1 hypothetical protein AciX9_4101 [Granulicella tundricola MP5ACTX9]